MERTYKELIDNNSPEFLENDKKYAYAMCPICESIVAGCRMDFFDNERRYIDLIKDGFIVKTDINISLTNIQLSKCNCRKKERRKKLSNIKQLIIPFEHE